MFTYEELKKSPRKFPSIISLKVGEFDILLPFFAEEYEASNSGTHTRAGQARQRQGRWGEQAETGNDGRQAAFHPDLQKDLPVADSTRFAVRDRTIASE